MVYLMTNDWQVNDFAIRSFRDIADEDYISARMAFRAALVTPSLWESQQAVEKYLKCILLLNRIRGKRVKHRLGTALDAIEGSGKLLFYLTPTTRGFIGYLDEFGPFRYLELSNIAFGRNLISLDRAVWELRRYCTLSDAPRRIKLRNGITPPKVCIPDGYLERVMDDIKNPAREPLLWSNAFFGKRQRRRVRINGWMKATNSPLYLNPQILEEVLKYVYLPKDIIDGYRAHNKP
jgi:HEPN domain